MVVGCTPSTEKRKREKVEAWIFFFFYSFYLFVTLRQISASLLVGEVFRHRTSEYMELQPYAGEAFSMRLVENGDGLPSYFVSRGQQRGRAGVSWMI